MRLSGFEFPSYLKMADGYMDFINPLTHKFESFHNKKIK